MELCTSVCRLFKTATSPVRWRSTGQGVMDPPEFLEGRPQAHCVDQGFTEAISQKMQVPERLSVGVGPREEGTEKLEDLTLAYRMHVPDRLSLAEAMDLNPRPFFSTSFKHSAPPHVGLAWDVQSASRDRSTLSRDPPVSPLRRSFSDQTINWSPPVTPTASKQILHTPPVRSTGRPPQCPGPPTISPSLLTPQQMLRAAKDLGRLASQRVLQSVTQKYSSRSSCPESPPTALTDTPSTTGLSRRSTTTEWLAEDDGGGNVEFLVLRRQVVKMNRRLAALERQNAERRQSEQLLFSLLISACLLNGWLWLRR